MGLRGAIFLFCGVAFAVGPVSVFASSSSGPSSSAAEEPATDKPAVKATGKEKDRTHELQNLVFYPHLQEWTLTTSYQTTLNQVGSTVNGSGNESKSTITGYSQVPVTLTYGLYPRWRLSISQTDLLQESVSVTAVSSGATTLNSASGWSNPTFALSWRALQNLKTGHFQDVVFSLTPQATTHYAAVSGQPGDNLSGGMTATLSAPWFWASDDIEFEIEPSLTYHNNSYSQGPDAGSSSATAVYYSGTLTLIERNHVNKYFYIEPILNILSPYTTYSTGQGSAGNVTTTALGTSINPEVDIGFLAAQWCIFSASITYASTNDSVNSTAGTANQSVSYNSKVSFDVKFYF